MSIVAFHRLLISCAILFCLFFGLWSGAAWSRRGSALDLVLAGVFLLAGAGLVWYLIRLNRFLGRESGP